MKFEYDSKKSKANEAKHGINFGDAQELWSGETLVLRSRNPKEDRLLVIGKIKEKRWTAIVAMRGRDKDRIRIISVRRSRNEEKEIYKKI